MVYKNIKPKVAVLYGGLSEEREVSKKSAQEVLLALKALNYDAQKIAVGKDLISKLNKSKPDIVFVAMHGSMGEDGTIQALLDIMQIPYTGSGVLASALAMHKTMAKRLFAENGINTPAFVAARKGAEEEALRNIKGSLRLPVVVKPASQGSTIGLSVVKDENDLENALEAAFDFDDEALIEEFVEGCEITVGVLGNSKPVALPTLEISIESELYDYETKYTKGMSNHIIPARITKEQEKQAKAAALLAHKALGCRGFSRADFICPKGAKPVILEVNTIPGLTKLSLFPDAAKAAGYGFNELIEQLLELACEKKA